MILDEKGIPVVIQARRFELVDKEGCVLSRIEADEKGGGEISIYNKNGQGIVKLSTTEKGGLFGITNKNGMWVAGITVTESGAGGIVIRNSKGKLATHLGVTSKDEHGIILTYNNEGKAIVSLKSTENGDGTIVTYSKDGKEIVNTAKYKLKLKKLKIANPSTIYFISAIIAATVALYISSWSHVRDYGPLIYAFGIISGSCFISSALALKRQEVVKYVEHSAVGVCDREVSP